MAGFLTLDRTRHTFIAPTCIPGFCSSNPITVAKGANLTLADLQGFASPFSKDRGSRYVVAAPTPPGPCAPVTGQALLAVVASPVYSAESNQVSVESDVYILANHQAAMTGIAAVANPTFATECYKPTYDSIEQSSLSQTNLVTPCGLQLVGSTILPYDTNGEPSVNYRYSAQIHCSLHNTTTTDYTDIMDAVVGRAFVKAIIMTYGSPPSEDLETTVIEGLTGSAEEYRLITPTTTQKAMTAASAPPILLTPALAAMQPTSAVPPCDEQPGTVCPSSPLPAQSSLTLGLSANGGSYEVAPNARIVVTVPSGYQGIVGDPPPGLRLLSQRSAGATVTYEFQASGLPGGQLGLTGTGLAAWSVAIGVA